MYRSKERPVCVEYSSPQRSAEATLTVLHAIVHGSVYWYSLGLVDNNEVLVLIQDSLCPVRRPRYREPPGGEVNTEVGTSKDKNIMPKPLKVSPDASKLYQLLDVFDRDPRKSFSDDF